MYSFEKYIERTYAKYANKLGCKALKFSAEGHVGYPDRLTLLPGGHILLIEFKAKGKKPTELQLRVHKELEALGFEVHVCDNFDAAKNLLDAKLRIIENENSLHRKKVSAKITVKNRTGKRNNKRI